ncbi:MAG: DUF1080 domain-containing protein [Opitutales bacterium]
MPFAAAQEWRPLLDVDLSNFEIWMGVPHSSVEGLPEGTFQSGNVHVGTPMGLDADVKDVFTVIEGENSEPVLYITGEIYGGLTTKESFDSYQLSTQFRWGDRKWEPRLNRKRDSGILYHCHGEHGAFWQAWKACLEFQVQESDLGDFIPLAGPRAQVRGVQAGNGWRYDADSDAYDTRGGYTQASAEPDSPHGEWNRLELFVVGNDAVHVVNGEVVMVVEDAVKGDGTPLTSGQIQLQSEAAECFFRDLKIRPITAFPETIAAQISLR